DRLHPTQQLPAPLEQGQRSFEVAAAPVVQGDRQLQHPLVEIPQLPLCPHPKLFQGFMGLEPVAAVELVDGLEQLLRRRILALSLDAHGRPSPSLLANHSTSTL